MKNNPSSLLNKLIANPKRIFLIDATGAVFTAVLLSIVLARFEEIFGMSQDILYCLAAVAGLFAVFSFTCYLIFPLKWRPCMRFIALANLCYCFATMGLIVSYWRGLSGLGVAYFFIEILVIIAMSSIEYNAASMK